MSKQEKKKVYNFGEKTEEYHSKQNKKLPVWQSPKYLQSKIKAIELIESEKYGLDEGDFWILQNATKSGKMMYTGLIVCHNGCLKINDKLDDKMRFKPSSVEIVKDEAEKVKVMKYVNDEQGVYEFGEISPKNCMNDYPYAMVLKRLMDRVILKTSKIGFFGIYSDSESEDFKEKLEPKEISSPKETTNKQKLVNLTQGARDDMTALCEAQRKTKAEEFFKAKKNDVEACGSIEEIEALFEDGKMLKKLDNYPTLKDQLKDCKEAMIKILDPEEEIIDYTAGG